MDLFFPMLLTGLLTSFHCVMMCGNLVLSYAVQGAGSGPAHRRLLPHAAYHGSKIVGYTLVGLLLGSVGLLIPETARAWVSVLAGFYMVLLGLGMSGAVPAFRHLTPRPPKALMDALRKLRATSSPAADGGDRSLLTPITFGLITSLMPCGPLQAAQVAAAGTGSPGTGALVMLAFGLGSVPLMLGYGVAASYLSTRFKRVMAIAAAVLIIALGLVMMNRGATALGLPVTFESARQAITERLSASDSGTVSPYTVGADGVVEVPFVVEGSEYSPATVVVPEGVPVRLVADRRDASPCSDELLIPELGVRVVLAPNGMTEVNISAASAGDYQITCQMGMMSGTLRVVPAHDAQPHAAE